ncbi:patatin-like phospholipase family protein [Planosporangium sp. 12N6]|uniref:patatin-like phospholipase family protein n=1 Tax=Planosporangium spinosum TaxID=3402278 RepID=UPI003CED7D3D
MIIAVDAASGERVPFSNNGEVSLIDAVAASAAAPGFRPPVRIGGRVYIDGGVASCANADLATGYDRVLVISPVASGSGPIPSVKAQVAELEKTTRVALVVPDRASRRAMGRNPMDITRRADAARAGRAQGTAVAAEIGKVWSQ